MLTDEVIDEDIEALLYAQVYYGKSDDTNLSQEFHPIQVNITEKPITETTLETTSTNTGEDHIIHNEHNENIGQAESTTPDKPNSIDNQLTKDISETLKAQESVHIETPQQQFIEISTTSAGVNPAEKNPTVVTQIPLLNSPSNASSNQQHLLNNITINQYIYPGEDFSNKLKSFRESIIWSKQCDKDLRRLQKGKIDEKDFFKNLKRRLKHQKNKLKKQEQIRKAFFKRQQNIASSEIICLSDSDNSDIEFVGIEKKETEVSTTVPEQAMPHAQESNSEEDEIIYVSPPPVPVIDVADDSDSDVTESTTEDSSVKKSTEKPSEDIDDCSNDFLPPTSTSENFNFGLHGAEFQDTDFVKPANPTDVYETESSTSTSDFNRDSSREFSNSVKTIVFNEVDFPKEDIFEENNLDKFGEFITPKRTEANELNATEKEDDESLNSLKRSEPRASSESSSESDYDTSKKHKNLPDLSPMISIDGTSKRQKKKHKRKSQGNFSKDNDGILDHDNVVEQVSSRKEKRRASVIVEEDETPKKRSKKKKKKSAAKNLEEPTKNSSTVVTDNEIDPGSPLRTTSQATIPTEAMNDIPQPSIEFSSKKKNKKKKGQGRNDNANVDSTMEGSRKKAKRKKGGSNTLDQDLEGSGGRMELESIENTSRTKVKRRKQKTADFNEEMIEGNNSSGKSSEGEVSSANKGKKIKKNPIDKRASNDENSETKKDVIENILPADIPKLYEAKDGEQVIVETHEEDIFIIEPKIPIHTIESSDSEDDIISLENVGDQLELANVNASETNDLPGDFNVEHLQSKMSDDPNKWKVLPTDVYRMNVGKKGLRCNRCRQFGHIGIHCPSKSPIPNCSLCGGEGHMEPRCPNKICLICAKPGKFSSIFCYKCTNQKKSTCSLCHLQGHSKNYCPDQWRRYFMTTQEGTLVRPKSQILKPRSEQWCSGCATQGHLEHECNSYKWIREYPATSPRIFKFQDVYETKTSDRDNSRNKMPPSVTSDFDGQRLDDSNNLSNHTSQEETEMSPANLEDNTPSTSNRLDFQPPTDIPSAPGLNNHVSFPLNVENRAQSSFLAFPNQPNQDIVMTSQQPQSNTLYLPLLQQEMSRIRERRRRPRGRARLNPLSVLRPAGGFHHYQNVLNPYSVMDAPQMASTPGADVLRGIGDFFMDTSRYAEQRGLYNSIPNTFMAQQVRSLMNNVAQRTDLTQDLYLPGFQYTNNQIMSNFGSSPNFGHNFSDSMAPGHFNSQPTFHGTNREYLDVPFTITREPEPRQKDKNLSSSEAPMYEAPTSRIEERKRNARISAPPLQTQPPVGFISLDPEENCDGMTSFSLNNVEEAVLNKFKSFPIDDLHNFVKDELDKLDNIKNPEVKVYKKKLNSVEQLKNVPVKTSSIKKQIYFHYKHLNMFLFGVQQLGDGKRNLDFLRNFIHNPGRLLSDSKRSALLEAYGYIFGGEQSNFNYRKHLFSLSIEQKRGK